MPATIHPTAIVDAAAILADDVSVGPYSIIDGPVRLGSGCKVGPHCHLIGPMTMGPNNAIGTGCVLGDEPQHLAASGEGADLVIGTGNTFREHVTIHRGSGPGKATRIGDHNYLMAACHVGHDATVHNKCIFANNALLAGHCVIGDNVFLSGNSAVHQRNVVGRYALVGGCSATSKDVPPFVIVQHINQVCGVNVIGMRRGGFTGQQIDAIRAVFKIVYMQGNLISHSLAVAEREHGHVDVVAEFIEFVRASHHGISTSVGGFERRAA